MANNLDIYSVEVNLKRSSIDKSEPPSSPAILETTDYGYYLRKIAGVNVSFLTLTIICIVLDLAFSLIMLGMGASNQSSCPSEPRIPIYLIIYGIVNIVSLGISIIACVIHYQGKDENLIGFYWVHCSAVVIIILQVFNYSWLLVGSIWTFRIARNVQFIETDQLNYCDQNFYRFSVVSTTLQFISSCLFGYCKSLPWK